MEQKGPSNGDISNSTKDFGWEDYTVNPGQYNVPQASDISGNSGASFTVVEGSGSTGGLGWEDFTTKTDRNDIIESIDSADGRGSIFTLDNEHPIIGVTEDQDNSASSSAQGGYSTRIRNAYLAERFSINEEMLKQKCERIGAKVLAVGLKSVLPNYMADLEAAGIVLVPGNPS